MKSWLKALLLSLITFVLAGVFIGVCILIHAFDAPIWIWGIFALICMTLVYYEPGGDKDKDNKQNRTHNV